MAKKAPPISEDQSEINYIASPTGRLFHNSPAFLRGVRGPVGSGKTVMCTAEILKKCSQQAPYKGVRRSRWCLIRNTYNELINTTMATWRDWVPEGMCVIHMSPRIIGYLQFGLPDGTRVEAEILFLALDRPEDAGKLKSLELTGVFINEASEIRKHILDIATTRVGRYPKKQWGGPSWTGIIMDTNPPSDKHWWYNLAEVEQPAGYEFFAQPPAVVKLPQEDPDKPPMYAPNDGSHGIPAAENIENLPDGFNYYMRQVGGKDPEFVRVYLMNEYGALFTGKPVFPEYSDIHHRSSKPLEPIRALPLVLAWDFGLTPACAVMQQSANGQLVILREFVSEDMGIERFARDVVKPKVFSEFAGMKILSVGDPAGSQRSQADETTCFQMLHRQGLKTMPAPTNSFPTRREAVAFFLTQLINGAPGMILDPSVDTIRRGFLGGYHFRLMQMSGEDRYSEVPDKNSYSHIMDAVQYGCSFIRSMSYKDTGDASDSFGGGGYRPIKPVDPQTWD